MSLHNFLSFVKQWGETAIYTASAQGDTETVKVLLQAKADTEIQDTVTAFFCEKNYFIVIKAPIFLIQLH